MDQFTIEDATRDKCRLRLALTGSTGSGKTFTALNIGTNLGGKVCLIDTENHSASKYGSGKPFNFKTIVLKKPYSLEKYIAAIQFVEKSGFDVCIIDSLTHAWSGAGGALEAVDDAARRSRAGNSYTAWRDVTPLHRKLIETILESNMDVIATMRSKMDFVQEKDERTGKTAIRKVGLAPIQRDDMAYEFDIVGDIDSDHVMCVSKSRCAEIADAVIRKPGAEFAATLKNWLSDGAVPAPVKEEYPQIPSVEDAVATPVCENPEPERAEGSDLPPNSFWTTKVAADVRKAQEAVAARLAAANPESEAFSDGHVKQWLKDKYGITSRKQATEPMVSALKDWLRECFKAGKMVA